MGRVGWGQGKGVRTKKPRLLPCMENGEIREGVHSKQLWVPFRIFLRMPPSRTAPSDEERVMVLTGEEVHETPKLGADNLGVARYISMPHDDKPKNDEIERKKEKVK